MLRYFIDDILPSLLAELDLRLAHAERSNLSVDLQAELLELTTRLMGKIAYDVSVEPPYCFRCSLCR